MYEIFEVLPGDIPLMQQVEQLLRASGIRRDHRLDYTCVLLRRGDEEILATGSCFQNTLRCFAVQRMYQGEGLLNRLVDHLLNVQLARGNTHVFLCTTANNSGRFQGLGFYPIACVPGKAALLENRSGAFENYCRTMAREVPTARRVAAVVIKADPFTLGHRALVARAARESDCVLVFMVSEDAAEIPFAARRKMICDGVADLHNVCCRDSGPYIISGATFPSYFAADDLEAEELYAQLDLAIFQKISGALAISARYVGEEPSSRVTNTYNRVMQEVLPSCGIDCVLLPRIKTISGKIISASTVRTAIGAGNWALVREMTPDTTWQWLQSPEADLVLKKLQTNWLKAKKSGGI